MAGSNGYKDASVRAALILRSSLDPNVSRKATRMSCCLGSGADFSTPKPYISGRRQQDRMKDAAPAWG